MKILYSHRIRSRDGQAVHLEAMVAALRAQGHAVEVVGPAGFAAAGLGGASRWLGWVRAHLPGWAGELAEMAYALPATWRLARAARRFAPDVIYERANLFHPAGALVAAQRGLPLLLEVNAPLAEERARFGRLSWRRLAAESERFVWRRATRVLPVTQVLADLLARQALGQSAEGAGMRLEGVDFCTGGEAEQGLTISPHIGPYIKHHTALDLGCDLAEEALLRHGQTISARIIDGDAIATQCEIIDRAGQPCSRGPVHRPYQRIGRHGQPAPWLGWRPERRCCIDILIHLSSI
jgi:hypothetical protein